VKEKPIILVMYGYHRREKFAIDVGTYMEGRDLGGNVKVLKYGGKPDVREHVGFGQKPIFPNYWKFVRNQGHVDFLIDLHNGEIVKRKEKLAAFLIYGTKNPDVHRGMFGKVKDYADSLPCQVASFYEPGTPYVPAGIDQIEVELLPPRISLQRACEFMNGLVGVLSRT